MPTTAKPEMYNIDTSNVLFILSGAFVGLEGVVKRRVAKGVNRISFALILKQFITSQSIGFTADLPQEEENHSAGFMPFFTPNRRTPHNMLDLVEPIGVHFVTQQQKFN
jgi:ATP-dependent Clp protease ATP-binding subunit ClpX